MLCIVVVSSSACPTLQIGVPVLVVVDEQCSREPLTVLYSEGDLGSAAGPATSAERGYRRMSARPSSVVRPAPRSIEPRVTPRRPEASPAVFADLIVTVVHTEPGRSGEHPT